VQGLQNQLRGKDTDIETLQAQLVEKTTACNAQQGEVQGLQKQLRGKDTDIETLQAQLAEKTAACSAQQGEVQGLQNQLRGKDTDIETLRAQLEHKNALLLENERSITHTAAQKLDMAMDEFKFFLANLQAKHAYTAAFGVEFENINGNTKIPNFVKGLIVQVQEQERTLYTQRLRELQRQAEEVDTENTLCLFALRDRETSELAVSAQLENVLDSTTELLTSMQNAQSKAQKIIALQKQKIEDVQRGL
jgi:chromosome segregation ATPase